MQKLFLFIFILQMFICINEVSAQSIPINPNKKNAQGKKEGKWTYLYDKDWKVIQDKNAAVYYRLMEYKKDAPHGKVRDYFKNGKVQMEADSVLTTEPDDIFEGLVTYFYDDGSVLDYKFYKSGKLDMDKTIQYAEKLLSEKAVTGQGEKSPAYFRCLNNLIALLNAQGKYFEVETRMKQALDIIKEARGDKHPAYATYLYNLAGVYRSLGNYSQAEPLYKQALAIRKEALEKRHADVATVQNDLAGLYYFIGNYSEAEKLFRQALSIRKEKLGEKHFNYATTLNDLAELYVKIGAYDEAEKFFLQSAGIFKETLGEKHTYFATSLNNQANLYEAMGVYSKAEPLMQQALRIFREESGEKHVAYATTLNNLARLYADKGNYALAEKFYEQALAIRKETLGEKHPDYANSLHNMAMLYTFKGEYAKADSYFQQALSLRKELLGEKHPDYSQTLRNSAKLYFLMGKYSRAEPLFKQANQGLSAQIESYFPFLTEREKEEFYNNKIKFHFEEFNTFALRHSKENPEILGDMFNNQLTTKALLLNASNKWKQRIKNSGDMKLIREFDEWQNQKAYLTKLYHEKTKDKNIRKTIDSLETKVNRLEKKLSEHSENFANIQDKKLFTWQEIQAKLKPTEAAVEIIHFRKYGVQKMLKDSTASNMPSYPRFGLTDTVYYAALIVTPKTRKYPELVLFENGNEMEEKFLINYRNKIKFKKDDDLSYEKFWAPIAKQLKGVTKVYFSPDGVYNQVNMSSLRNPATGKYILDELDLQRVTNSKDLVTVSLKDEFNNFALFFGAPNFGMISEDRGKIVQQERSSYQSYYSLSVERSYNLVQLPGTKTEVESISQMLKDKGWTLKVYLGDEALEENLKENYKPRVLHVATHGFFDPDVNNQEEDKFLKNPLLRSGLMLTGAANSLNDASKKNVVVDEEGEEKESLDDGILTAYEAMNLNLDNTDLVVLSACETGVGEIKNGEGVYGLQRAFKVAGARTIVMSLWNVNDQTTQELMTTFYRNWLTSNDKHQAFKDAQLEIRKKYKEPYYWGAFVMVGD